MEKSAFCGDTEFAPACLFVGNSAIQVINDAR
jgi:hypothetical protein